MKRWLPSCNLALASFLLVQALSGQDGGTLTLGGSVSSGNPIGGIFGGAIVQTSSGGLTGNAFSWATSPGSTLTVQSGSLQVATGSTLNLAPGSGSTINVAGSFTIQTGATLTLTGFGGSTFVSIGNLVFLPGSRLRVVVNSLPQLPVQTFSLLLGGGLELVAGDGFGFRAGDRIRLFTVFGGSSNGNVDLSPLQLPPGVTGSILQEGNEVILRVDSAVSSSLINVSARSRVEAGDNVLIGGFVLTGTEPKRVLLTAFGPSLTNFGVAGALSRTSLRIFSAESGALVASNEGWRQGPASAALAASGFAPNHEREAALLLELPPGAYTAVVSGVGGESGVGLLEVFDLHKEGRAAARPINLSARARVLPGDQALIGGFVLDGKRERKVLVRVLGPSLSAAGVSGALAAPTLELRDAQGALVASNQGWRATQSAEVQATGLAPLDARECAIIATLPPGAYTSVVRSVDAQASGVALVEMFDLE